LKKNFRNLALALIFLIPTFPNNKLSAKINNIIYLENKIQSKDKAFKDIDELIKLTEIAQQNGNYSLAISYLEKILKIEKQFLGENNNDVANTLKWIGQVYISQENFNEAKSYLYQSLSIKNSILGEDHIDLITIYYSLGYLNEKQFLLKEAEDNYLYALKIIKK